PGYEPPPPIDRQIALFMEFLPTIDEAAKSEIGAVAKALSDSARPAAPVAGTAGAAAAAAASGGAPAAPVTPEAHVAELYAAAWKSAIDLAHSSGRTISFRGAQDLAEQAAPHDGSGIVGVAGVAAGGIFMRDLLPIEQVLLLYELFAGAFAHASPRSRARGRGPALRLITPHPAQSPRPFRVLCTKRDVRRPALPRA